jgi:hypothetical protein
MYRNDLYVECNTLRKEKHSIIAGGCVTFSDDADSPLSPTPFVTTPFQNDAPFVAYIYPHAAVRLRNFTRQPKEITWINIFDLRAGVHAPTNSASVPASIWLLPPVQPRTGVHTYRQNRYRRLKGGQFREWCRAVDMAPTWNRRLWTCATATGWAKTR